MSVAADREVHLLRLWSNSPGSLGPDPMLYRAARRMGLSPMRASAYRMMVLDGWDRLEALRHARTGPFEFPPPEERF